MTTSVSGGGSFLRFRTGTTGLSGRHVAYITRERAVVDREKAILLYQLPEHVRGATEYKELRQTLIAYADTREEIEVAQHTARGNPRTHYRVLASFERDVTNEQALGMVKEWLDREFPRSRAFAVVHRDTEQTHVHVWIDARQIDGKKIQLARQQHRSLDTSWNHIYSREMGIDPNEHERKKEETRAAKREAWERHTKPELPPRVRKDAQELTPNWQRRELGVQASREWAERPGGTFLERVRATAGPDLQQAKSWDDLDRRLERHGLRIEPKGVGMVITDGRHYVKASSVDREASRGKLEKRFGVTLAEHRTKKLERRGLTPRAQEVADDLRVLDLRGRLKAGLARETERLEAARARVAEQRWARERADRASRAFDDALGRAFAEPKKAREAFERRARELDPARAANEMRQNPEAFGDLREGEKRRRVGLAQRADPIRAREAARNAAELGRESATAAALAPDAATLTRAEQLAQRAGLRVKELTERLDRTRDNGRTRIRIGLAMRALAPREVKDLHRVITAPHRQITVELRRAATKLAPEHLRDLTHWARSPHLALPTSAARSFRALLNDRKMERGSE
jgi:hypothetical protein